MTAPTSVARRRIADELVVMTKSLLLAVADSHPPERHAAAEESICPTGWDLGSSPVGVGGTEHRRMTMSSTADVLLSDGGLAVVRTLEPGDGAALHDLHERASDDALWLRFFSVSRGTAHRYVDHVLPSPGTIAVMAGIDGRIATLR